MVPRTRDIATKADTRNGGRVDFWTYATLLAGKAATHAHAAAAGDPAGGAGGGGQ